MYFYVLYVSLFTLKDVMKYCYYFNHVFHDKEEINISDVGFYQINPIVRLMVAGGGGSILKTSLNCPAGTCVHVVLII